MDVKSTLKVINEKDYPGQRGVTEGQTYTRLVGWPEVFMTDRVRLGRASYLPGTYEQLHWHPIEACYYVISGHATVRDVEGRTVTLDLSQAHFWDITSVTALDKICQRLRKHGSKVEVLGMNDLSRALVSKLDLGIE